ncbi:ASKHA domain-containing protein [Chloroflexota bacterium]
MPVLSDTAQSFIVTFKPSNKCVGVAGNTLLADAVAKVRVIIYYLGNTSAWGAYIALPSLCARDKAGEIANKMKHLELISDNSLMNEFAAALFPPHTKIESFPPVKKLLTEAG